MKINIKMDIRQYVTEKNKTQNRSYKNPSKCLPPNNTLRQKNSYEKNIINKKCNYIKIAKMLSNNNKKIAINNNNSTPKNNKVFIDLSDFKNHQAVGNNTNSYKDLSEREKKNKEIQQQEENKKIMIKQIPYDIKKYLNKQNNPKYDCASFRKAIKYYTLKSNSKTIQVQDLSTYFKPIKNILRIKSIQKTKMQQKKANYNSNILINNDNHQNNIKTNNVKEKRNRSMNYELGKNNTQSIYINLLEIEKPDINLIETFNNTNNNANNTYIQNCYFNKNSIQTDRMNKKLKFPFNIRVKQVNKAIKIINKNNKNFSDTMSFNNNNSKNISDYDTQISMNNNINNMNKNVQLLDGNSKTLYQFRPRKIHLPKTGINLSSMQYKNKILQNILHKRKEMNKI